ncbi:MAG: hypothetical protein AABY05_03365 [Nanoarchaeota archaeon]
MSKERTEHHRVQRRIYESLPTNRLEGELAYAMLNYIIECACSEIRSRDSAQSEEEYGFCIKSISKILEKRGDTSYVKSLLSCFT